MCVCLWERDLNATAFLHTKWRKTSIFPHHCLMYPHLPLHVSVLSPSGPVSLGSRRGSGRASGGTAEPQSDQRGSREWPLKPGAWGRSCGSAAGCMTLESLSHQQLSVRSRTAPLPCARSDSVLPLAYQDKISGRVCWRQKPTNGLGTQKSLFHEWMEWRRTEP